MMLKFRDCTQCGESHALRPNGQMSIHQTAAGDRCEEPLPREEQKKARRRRQRDAEREAAFDLAAERKRRKPQKRDRFDRSIYAVSGPSYVSGGLPGSSRRH